MSHSIWTIALMLFVGCAARATAQDTWLPPHAQGAVAQQLAGRLTSLGPQGAGDAATDAELARTAVQRLRERLESWREAGVLQRAPTFPLLEVPKSPQPHLDAMGRYNVCNMALFLQFEGATPPDLEARRAAAHGLTALAMAVVYLRQPFVAAGGTEAGIEAFLTSPSLAPILNDVQARPELMSHVQRRCAPVMDALLGPEA